MKINCIVLAAGLSSRFGENKLLVELDGKTVIGHTLDKVKKYPFNQITLVTTEQVRALIGDVLEDSCIVINKEQQLGMSHSVRLGLISSTQADAYLFIVGDQPLLSFYTLERFIKGFEHSGSGIGCVSFKGGVGNPTLFAAHYKDQLLNLVGDRGGRKIIKQNPDDVWTYEVQREIELQDMDTKQDYQLICKYRTDEV
ncbi:MAG: nucleotidyltransferase family protein [Cellulosilyticaceae bacterium]